MACSGNSIRQAAEHGILRLPRQAMIDEFDLDQDGEINLDVSIFRVNLM